jgi:uncharacterized protein (DUF1697 family)
MASRTDPNDTWIVLLRGINVGGNNVIPMAQLRAAFEEMGFEHPVTYIQSGNVLVDTRERPTGTEVRKIERGLSERFAYQARVVVRTSAQLGEVVRDVPAEWDPSDRTTRHNVIFLADGASPGDLVNGLALDPARESAWVGRHAVYWSAPLATITRTAMLKLSAHPLYPEMTVRNLRTTLKLHELAQARGGTT